MALQKAEVLEMPRSGVLLEAAELAERLAATRAALRGGIREVSVDKLRAGLAMSEILGLKHYEQPKAAHLLAELERIGEEAAKAADEVEPIKMAALLEQADALNYALPALEQIRALLQLPAERLVEEQLRAAARLGLGERADELQILLKNLFFEKNAGAFELERFPRLRTPDDFAAAKLGLKKAMASGKSAKEERREAFLRHQTKPIPTSLTQIEHGLRTDAVQSFRCVQGFMGDSVHGYPLTLVQEMLAKALAGGAPLQTEVYVQLMKQLVDNPSGKSEKLGWSLFALWLQAFPPDAGVEDFVEWFVRSRATPRPAAYLRLLYATKRRGALLAAPSDGQINLMLSVDCSVDKPTNIPKLY